MKNNEFFKKFINVIIVNKHKNQTIARVTYSGVSHFSFPFCLVLIFRSIFRYSKGVNCNSHTPLNSGSVNMLYTY